MKREKTEIKFSCLLSLIFTILLYNYTYVQISPTLTVLLRYNSHKIKPFKNVQFSSIQYIHNVVQPPPVSGSKTCSAPPKENPLSVRHSGPIFPLPQPLTIINLLSFSMDLPILDSSYKWNYTACDLLCQASFTQLNIFLIFIYFVVLKVKSLSRV